MRRCPGCGGFFRGDECPNEHVSTDYLLPILPPPKSLVGRVVSYDWPGEDTPILALITSHTPDENDEVGLMILTTNRRVPLSSLTIPKLEP